MAIQTTLPLTTVAAYQNLFNSTNTLLWSGSEKMIPVMLSTGSPLWIAGMSWSGVVEGGVRISNVHNTYSEFLLQGNSSLRPYQTSLVDSVNNRNFTLPLVSSSASTFPRLDPVAAVVDKRNLIITCRLSTTDFTNWTLPLGPFYALIIPTSSIADRQCSVSAISTLPTYSSGSTNIYFGSSLYLSSDGYLYMTGQMNVPSTTSYNHYLARVPSQSFYYNPSWQFFVENNGKFGWSSSAANATPILSGVGPEVSMWQQGGIYYILAKSGPISNNINLYFSPTISGVFQFSSMVATAVTPPSGGWSNGAYVVPFAQLADGKRLGFYSQGIINDTYDIAHPLYKKIQFFEF
jgi:hypothetical protein